MNVLLTGGVGYIGSHVAVSLIEIGNSVVLYDNLSNSKQDVVKRIGGITGVDIPFVCGDIRDTDLLIKTLKQYQIEAVIHLAGFKAVGESVANPVDYYDNNVQGTISLIQAMKSADVKKVVFSSSATVYGNPKYLPIDEKHPIKPFNPYGRTKSHIEDILEDMVVSDDGWKVSILRYFNPVGAHHSGLIGESPNGVPNNLMPYLVDVAAGEREKLLVFGNDYDTKDGTGVRDYIHVMDLAEGHSAALEYLDKTSEKLTIFNLGTGVGLSVLEILKAL